MTQPTTAHQQAPPQSPFFRPHVPARRVVEQTLSTPLGRHQRKVKTVQDTAVVVEHKSGLLGCAANLMTCIVGSGIVGLPYAMQQTGFLAGIFLIVLTAALTAKSLRLLVETAKHLHKQTYETVAEVTFGITGFRFILINMFVMAYGAMVTYLMITKSCASIVLLGGANMNETQQQFVLLVISLLVQLPLACMRDMADLEKTSGLAVAIDVTIVGLVAYASPWMELQGVGAVSFLEEIRTDTIHTSSLFVGLGVLSFAFECQEAAFLVAGSLKQPTVARWAKVTTVALAACLILSMTCGVTGYLGYGDATKGNILSNFDPSTTLSLVAHALLGVTMFATYPLASFVARHVCVVLLFEGPQAHEGNDSSILNRPDRRILLTFVLYLLAIIPATIFTDMGRVLAFAGVIGGSCLAYIGPGMLYLAVHGERFLNLCDTFFFVTDESNEVGTDRNGSLAIETTPLVESTGHTKPESKTRQLDGLLKSILWYLLGMPLWTWLAVIGQRRVLAHAQAIAEKNTVQLNLRIGEVDLKGMEKIAHASNSTNTPKPLSQRYSQGGSFEHFVRPRLSEDEDTTESGATLETMKRFAAAEKSKAGAPTLEADPQEKPPAWVDYFIAVFYICFGVLALFAGLISLYTSAEEDKTTAIERVSHL